VVFQVLRAFPAELEHQVRLEHLEFRVFLATQAVLAGLVHQDLMEIGDLQDLQVPRVLEELQFPAQLVNNY